jgi:tetratricopeptide (TPR) repeat protein
MDVSGDLVQRQHHVLEQAYTSLSPARRKLLSRIACFRSPVNYDALKALAEEERTEETASRRDANFIVRVIDAFRRKDVPTRHFSSPENLPSDLRDLIARGLLHHDLNTNRFDLHPFVRRYAYDRLAAPDRDGAHASLRDYFAAVPAPDKVHTLDDLAPVIELYHHTVRAGHYDEACILFCNRLEMATYFQLGAYQLRIDLLRALFPDGEDRPSRLNEVNQAWALNGLANSYSLSGQLRRAVPLFERQIASDEKRGDKTNLATALGNLASMAQIHIGALRAGEANLRRRVALCSEIKEEQSEGAAHKELGRLLTSRGAWAESERELATALETFEKRDNVQAQVGVWAYRALRELLRLRSVSSGNDWEPEIADLRSAIAPARRALELALGGDPSIGGSVVARDVIHGHWLMGAAHRVAGELDEAESHLHEALERCRHNNTVEAEADILIDLARLRMATAAPDKAQLLAEEALVITERCSHVLQGADAHLVLAQLTKDRGDAKALREHATEALRLATCDGPPDYTYKAAYDEATALLR